MNRTPDAVPPMTRRFLRRVIAVYLASLATITTAFPQAQFYTLSTAEGLSDNYINTMTVDRNGYLWVGTGSGLNRFNGKQVERFFAKDQPSLRSDIMRQVACDSANRLWILNDRVDLTIIDEDRRFRPAVLADSTGPVKPRYIFQTASAGTILLTNRGLWQFPAERALPAEDTIRLHHFDRLGFQVPDSLLAHPYYINQELSADSYVMTSPTHVCILDFGAMTLTGPLPCTNCRVIGSFDGHTPVVYRINERALAALNPHDGSLHAIMQDVRDQAGLPLTGFLIRMVPLDDMDMLIATRGNGAYVYRPSTGRLTHYPHDPANPTGLANPNPNVITATPSGWVFLGCTPQGISYFNHDAVIGQQTIFQDAAGRGYNLEVGNLTSPDGDTYYLLILGSDLLVWQRSTNTSRFIRLGEKPDAAGNYPGYGHVMADSIGRIWVSVAGEGLVVLDHKTQRVLKRIDLTKGRPERSPKNAARCLHIGPDGNVWASTRNGVVRIGFTDYAVELFEGTVLDSIQTFIVNFVDWPKPGKMWVATETRGVFVFDLEANTVTRHTVASGDLLSNSAFCINSDRLGNTYVGTAEGLTVFFTDGNLRKYTPENGLLNSRLEALLLDDKNRMWFGNDVAVGCFNIADTTIRMFDERFGLSVQGFRVYAYHQNRDGELVWGTERGIQYFYPDSLYDQQIDLQANIHRLEARDLDRWITRAVDVTLPPGNDFVTFHFSTLDFSKHIRTFYQYKLDGLDPGWITVMDQQTARYNSLKPGTYTFMVRASHDGKTWHDAEYPLTVTLQPFFYQTALFRWLVAGLLLAILYVAYRLASGRIRRRAEELEAEATVQYFASTINRHKDTEEMFQDVARHAVSRLGLDECVIYLMDPDRRRLLRKSAAAARPTQDSRLPGIPEIPLGRGIAGQVAMTGEPLVIADAEKDPRLLAEPGRSGSAIAVPIVLEGQVVGVIDGTGARKHVPAYRLLRMLTTIAVLMAAQIRRNEAEDAKRRAEVEVLQNKRQAAESRLQSLRLQMNPHFLFNALNSIQQMILANEELVATKYLSRFSKLLRSILVHSDKETVTLREELDMLRLYIELESVRFKEAFTYTIDVDDEIDPDEVKIPTLLIQPFVENAIWHGLMHKEGARHLRIAFTEEDDMIRCVIEDNGIGRKKAGEMKQISGQDKKHTSKGIAVARERLQSLQRHGRADGHMTFTDLEDAGGNALGTRVDILFPPQR